jgi:hypothetical protein
MPHSTTTFDTRKQALHFVRLLAERRGTRAAHGVANTYAPESLNYRELHRSVYVWTGDKSETWTLNFNMIGA